MSETVTVAPTEVRLVLRLKRSRFLLRIGDPQVGDLQRRLDRVSKYVITRLQRRYRSLAVTRPVWSIDSDPNGFGLPKRAFCYLGYVDLSPYTDKPILTVLPDDTRDVKITPNRAQRRAQA